MFTKEIQCFLIEEPLGQDPSRIVFFPNSWYQLRVLVGVKRVTIPGRIVRVLLGGCRRAVSYVCGVHFSVDEFVLRESPSMNS